MPKTKKLNRGVAMVGAGMSKFGTFKDKSIRDLFVEAFLEMMQSVNKGAETKDIEALFLGDAASQVFERQGHTAPLMADWIGLLPKAATRIESACASGGVTIRQGVSAIASGLHDVVLVGGVERMSTLPTEEVTDTLACFSDALYEATAGFSFPGLYASIATAYMARYGATVEDFMNVAIKNHKNGALNPKAQFNSTILTLMNNKMKKLEQKGAPVPDWKTEMDFLHDAGSNPIVAWPMRLFDCSPITDGAACILLVSEEIASNFTDNPLYIIGSGQGSAPAIHDREDMTSLISAKYAAREAYDMAGVGPEDIQITEVHDCFTIAEIVASEDLGYFKPGEGAKQAENGVTARDGAKPINTSGGLKSKGHPVGASGIGQAVEMWHQLRGEAGERQVANKNLRLGLTHNVGGSGGSCAVHIYERRS
ncbi:beta-ketoacyl synthase N-terminal-like domain-containing protein [Chloroflexota bacterium]